MKYKLSILFTLLFANNMLAKKYIDTSFYKNAFAVKNYEHVILSIDGKDKATYTVKKSITILSKKAASILNFSQHTDKFIKLEDVSIQLYDAFGKKQESYNKKDLDKNGFEATGDVTDNYELYKNIASNSFPCTIDISFTLKYKGILNFPNFRINSNGIATKEASLTVFCINNDINYKSYGIDANPEIATTPDKKYTWNFKNIKAVQYEEGSSYYDRIAQIKIVPQRFNLDGYNGEMTSWQKFGEWYGALSKDQINLDDATVQHLKQLTAPAQNETEKAKLLYDYLQKNFRYVSIQLGIGGFKPFSAQTTYNKKYGDCKALSNYMQSCLTAIGIKSYQALINRGYNEPAVDEKFTINEFNHVILCIPKVNDTIWLECTSNYNNFNSLGADNENRRALLITENGGVLINTPTSKYNYSVLTSKAIINPAADENNVTINFNVVGEFKDDFLRYINEAAIDDQLKYFHYYLNAKQPDQYLLNKQGSEYQFKLHYNKLHEFNAGAKHFYNPSIFPVYNEQLPNDTSRNFAFYFSYPYQKIDTTVFQLMENFSVETLPQNNSVNNDIFDYEIKFVQNDLLKTVTCSQMFTLKKHIIPAKQFKTIAAAFAQVAELQTKKLVLRKL
jgi:hypothetical protein